MLIEFLKHGLNQPLSVVISPFYSFVICWQVKISSERLSQGHEYRTRSGSDGMLALNLSLRSGRYRSRFCNHSSLGNEKSSYRSITKMAGSLANLCRSPVSKCLHEHQNQFL